MEAIQPEENLYSLIYPPKLEDSPCQYISQHRIEQTTLYTQSQLSQYYEVHTKGSKNLKISTYPEIDSRIQEMLSKSDPICWEFDAIKTPFLPPVQDAKGVVYEGQWLLSQRHGRGFMIGPGGKHYYEGDFRSGRRHGQGKCIFLRKKSDGQEELVFELGYFEHGKFVRPMSEDKCCGHEHGSHEHMHTHSNPGLPSVKIGKPENKECCGSHNHKH